MHPCTFSNEVPKICFLLQDKGDYYELQFRFKIWNKILIPNLSNPVFFIRAINDPAKFYLLSTHTDYILLISSTSSNSGYLFSRTVTMGITDYHITHFFDKFKFRLSVLKNHYEGYFKDFVTHLAGIYQIQYTGNKKHK